MSLRRRVRHPLVPLLPPHLQLRGKAGLDSQGGGAAPPWGRCETHPASSLQYQVCCMEYIENLWIMMN